MCVVWCGQVSVSQLDSRSVPIPAGAAAAADQTRFPLSGGPGLGHFGCKRVDAMDALSVAARQPTLSYCGGALLPRLLLRLALLPAPNQSFDPNYPRLARCHPASLPHSHATVFLLTFPSSCANPRGHCAPHHLPPPCLTTISRPKSQDAPTPQLHHHPYISSS